ncbi:cytochrome P450 [Neolentinus lepideus HHB14362 ss-1]|uniref:Cytochrome P450 n=1 Tax=Neolentinus lepideus HHB14362 ss-1 TaxID=1314782 RepID=A0A165QPD0_9AGAM|nr:cytochrome P450 [Neolentinus lepideus HHB14362 ss-1]
MPHIQSLIRVRLVSSPPVQNHAAMGNTFDSSPTSLLLYAGIVLVLYRTILRLRQKTMNTPLNGPPRRSLLWHIQNFMARSTKLLDLSELWIAEYGPVFRLPGLLGSQKIMLADPKALSHYYSKETTTYVKATYLRLALEKIVGRGLLWAEGGDHKRQRRVVAPAFSNSAIRNLTSVFFDSGYKVKTAWEALFQDSESDELVIDVQDWTNRVSLDSIGIAGFSHDFGALRGNHLAIAEIIESFSTVRPSIFAVISFILEPIFPVLRKVPNARSELTRRLNDSMTEISQEMIARYQKANDGDNAKHQDNSIIGLLIKAGDAASSSGFDMEEVISQMKALLLGGYESTSATITWILIELSRYPDKQAKLREELLSTFPASDPIWDQLNSDLPYLDAVVHEILRLWPPLDETWRVAVEDDVIPLSTPITTADGEEVDRISVAKGTQITIPIACMNRLEANWGPDAKEFVPERWLDEAGLPKKVTEIQGHRHLLTFIDGPRKCIGRGFALAEIKAVVFVLIRNFTFELRDGPGTKIISRASILPRPTVAGEEGCKMPLRVRRVN